MGEKRLLGASLPMLGARIKRNGHLQTCTIVGPALAHPPAPPGSRELAAPFLGPRVMYGGRTTQIFI
jgi:hypothetical protein